MRECLLPPPASVRRETLISTTSTIWAVIAAEIHLFPFRTEKLSPPAPMVLGAQAPGRVGRRPVLSAGRKPASRGFPTRDGSLKASAVAAACHALRASPSFLDCSLWSFATAISCLRPWTEDDVDAMVAGCNDPDVAWWIPTIPSPYSETDALAFIRGEVAPDERSFAMTSPRRCGRRHRAQRRRSGSTAARSDTGSRRTHAGRARALVPCVCSHVSPSTSSSFNGSTSSPIPTTSRRNVSPRRSGSSARASFAAHLRHPDGRIRDSVMFSLLPGELRE